MEAAKLEQSSASTKSDAPLPFDARAIAGLVRDVRAAFDSGRTRSIEWRRKQLDGLLRMIDERGSDLIAALHADVGKPPFEAYVTEVAYVASEARFAKKHLARWMKPERVPTSLVAMPGKSRIYKEPFGVVSIIGPWNYPFSLVAAPLVGAIAAGNAVVVKPSEVAPKTSETLASLLPRYLDPNCVRVVEGGVPETTALLAERFDYIFYTGNAVVARIVMRAASEHLTPLTLELGGKSPCIVDASADLRVTARRIAWGKFTNAGQTCVAPDYVLAHRDIHDALIDELARAIREFYGDDPKKSADYGRIVNARHHRRVLRLIAGTRVVVGGEADEAERYIAPTILRDIAPDAPVMGEEIFGPVLPVLAVTSVEEAIAFVNARPKPLALYLFSSDRAVQKRVLGSTSSGGATINHAWMHLAVPGLSFGGVGESGMGGYHGKASFDTFTHRKSVLTKGTAIDPSLTYPPYGPVKAKWIERFL